MRGVFFLTYYCPNKCVLGAALACICKVGVDLIHQLKMDWDLSASFLALVWLGWIYVSALQVCCRKFTELSRKEEEMLCLRQKNLMFDIFASCSVLQLAKFPSVIHKTPSLTKSNSVCRDRPADATDKLHRQYETSRCLDDAKSEPARSGPGAGTHNAARSGRVWGEEISNSSRVELEAESKLGNKTRGSRKS